MAGSFFRYDVGCDTAIVDDSVNSDIVRYLLAKCVDAVEHLQHGIEGVYSFFRVGGGMRRLPAEDIPDAREPQIVLGHSTPSGWVDHHRKIDFVEKPMPDELDL